MNNKKDSSGKNMTTTELSWSSDDEDENDNGLRRTTSLIQPSSVNAPRNSGSPQPSTSSMQPTRRNQFKKEKELLFSFLGSRAAHGLRSFRVHNGTPGQSTRSPTPSSSRGAQELNRAQERTSMVMVNKQNHNFFNCKRRATRSLALACAAAAARVILRDPHQLRNNAMREPTPGLNRSLAAARSRSERMLRIGRPPRNTASAGPVIQGPMTNGGNSGEVITIDASDSAPPPTCQRHGHPPEEQYSGSSRVFALLSGRNVPGWNALSTQSIINFDQSDNDVNQTQPGEPTNEMSHGQHPFAANNQDNTHEDNISLEETADLNQSTHGTRPSEEEIVVDEVVELDSDPSPNTSAHQAINLSEENRVNEEQNSEILSSMAGTQMQQHGTKRKRNVSPFNNEPTSLSDLNQSLLRLLECPVCLEMMEPPMSQCRRGHLVCSACRSRISSCPVCRMPFSSVRNRAMEGVAELLRYPCRHGCEREVRLRRRVIHEANCAARRYMCPVANCSLGNHLLPHPELQIHFYEEHPEMLKFGKKHSFNVKLDTDQHDRWLVLAMEEIFHVRIDVDISSWSLSVYVAYFGPKRNTRKFIYEVTILHPGQSRKFVYARETHSDLDNDLFLVAQKDCFYLNFDQALNFLNWNESNNSNTRIEKTCNFTIEISQSINSDLVRDDSD